MEHAAAAGRPWPCLRRRRAALRPGATGRPDGAGSRPGSTTSRGRGDERRARSRTSGARRPRSNGTQRTWSNSWSWPSQVAADRLHQEVVDGLVDPGPALDEPVLDRVEDVGDPDLETGLLGDLAEGRLLARLAGVRACPSAGSRSGCRDRGGGRRRRGRGLPSSKRTTMPPAEVAVPVLSRATAPWRRSSGGSRPRRRTPSSGRRPGPRPAVDDAAGRVAAVDRAPVAAELGEDAVAGSAEDRQAGRRGLERAGAAEAQPALARPGRRADEPRGRTGRVPRGDAVLHGRQWYRFNPALQGPDPPRIGGRRPLPVSARHAAPASAISRSASGAVERQRRPGACAPSAARWRASVPAVAAGHRAGQRAGDPEGPGVAQGLLDQRAVDREAARLVEPGQPPELGDRVEEGDEAARGEDRRRVVGGLATRARGGPAVAPSASAIRASRSRSWSSPSIAIVAPWSAATARSMSANATSGWNDPTWVPAAIAPAEGLGAEQRRSCGPSPGRRTCGARRRRRGIASSGTARMISSTSSTSGVASAKRADARDEAPEPLAPPGVPARDRVDRPAGPVEGDAERRADRARPDDPDDRRLARRALVRGDGGAGRRRGRGPGRRASCWPRVGSRSIPAASISRSVSLAGRRRRRVAAAAPGLHRPRSAGRGPATVGGTLPRSECTDRTTEDAWPSSDPFGARASLGPGPSRRLSAGRARRPDRPRSGARHPEDPARERPPPRRRRDRRAGATSRPWRRGGRARRPRPRSRSCPPG